MDAAMSNSKGAAVSREKSRASATSSLPLAYGIEHAADALGLSRSRLYELIAAGEIAVCKVGKRTIIPVAELTGFLDRHRVVRSPEQRVASRPVPAHSSGQGA